MKRESRTARVRSAKPRPRGVPSYDVLRHHYERLSQLPNVVGFFVGRKERAGKPGEIALRVMVSEKVPSSKLRHRSEAVPKYIEWLPTSKMRKRLVTDVLELRPESQRQAAVTGPGDGIQAAAGSIPAQPGTLGVALQHPSYGRIVTTAAHLFTSDASSTDIAFQADSFPLVQLLNTSDTSQPQPFAGRLLRYVLDADVDYALVLPHPDFPARNLYHDQFPVHGPRDLESSDVDNVAFVATQQRLVKTIIKGVHARIQVGNSVVENAVITTRVTVGGDSGSALLTSNAEAAALLTGFAGQFSVFLPLSTMLIRESATMALGEFNESSG